MSISTTGELLDVLTSFVKDMNTTNSDLRKEEIFKKYSEMYPGKKDPFLRSIVLVNSNLIPFNVTASAITKFKIDKKKQAKKIKCETYTDDTNGDLALFKILTDLHRRTLSGDIAKQTILDLISKYPDHEQLILNIMDKDLKIRYTEKSMNKVVDKLVPMFMVSLGEKYDNSTKKYLNKPWKNGWYISRKLDGVRCICKISFSKPDNIQYSKTTKRDINTFFNSKKPEITPKSIMNVEFFSRQGREFKTLKKLADDIRTHLETVISEETNGEGLYLDGEVCSIDDNGTEDFQGIMKEINKKNHVMANPKYLLFDTLSHTEFEMGTSERLFSERCKQLTSIIEDSECVRLSCIQQTPYNETAFSKMQEQVAENGWEGLILRKNDVYIGDRSKDLLKVKTFHREEYKVTGIESCKMRVINSDTGLEDEIDTLKAVIISHKGYNVHVGSGFTLDQRKEYYAKPNTIIGKVISVQFFEETKDMNGELSLRFPTFKGLYGDKREI